MVWIFLSLLQCIGSTFFKPSYKSNHSLIGIDCDCHISVSDMGYYKYNTSLLKNVEYVNKTEQSVLDIIEQSEDQNFNHRLTWGFANVIFRSIAFTNSCRLAKVLKMRLIYWKKA